jgi:thiamine biosynthesis lipoprotein
VTAQAIGTRTQTLTFGAMSTTVTLSVVAAPVAGRSALAEARAAIERVEADCTRFADSPLVRVNAAPDQWHVVPPELYLALEQAARAHVLTGGLFDPRVLRTLVALGYDRSLPFREGPVSVAAPAAVPPAPPAAGGPWRPNFDPARLAIHLGGSPVDLGGIGKGIAVDRAALELAETGGAHLVDAGGDCRFGGNGPDGGGWRVAVEDPFGSGGPLAVLRADDLGVATSSVRLRTWRSGDRRVHHIVDPRSGTSAETGLRAVTVLGPSTATAEVWAKALLIAGPAEAPDLAATVDLAALWIDDDRALHLTARAADRVLWFAPALDVRELS